MANRSNKCFSSFTPLDLEFSSGLKVIDNFSDHISFNVCDKGKDNKSCIHQLDEMVLEFSSSLSITIITSNMSIKNNVATSISHTHIYNKPITKMIHYVVHITSTEAKLFAIRCGINQFMNFDIISKIIAITNSIYAARKIFDLLVHPYQVQSAAILSDLHKFFNHHENNFIEFWEYPSHLRWYLYNKVNKETKISNLTLLYSYKTLWDFNKKSESNNILKVWKMIFQASDFKENHFLNLLDDNNNIIELSYVKGGPWLKILGYLNSLYVRATRVITNHAPTGKYRLRFFPKKKFKCLCSLYPIESRYYILYEYGRFNSY